MTKPTIAIIGAGHMGMGLLGGLIANGYPANKLFLADPAADKLQSAKQQFDIDVATDNHEICKTAEVIIFAVKPDIVSFIAKQLTAIIQKRKPLIISIAAGIHETSIQHWLGGNIPIVRAMPNMPALIGCGATAMIANSYVSAEQRQLATSILNSVGMAVWLDNEKLMDAVTALSGSGPAYFYLLMEAMQNAGEKLGLPSEIARALTLQTALGAASLALQSNKKPGELCRQAMTPGGTTEQAVRVFEENHLHTIVETALNAAANRANELAKL